MTLNLTFEDDLNASHFEYFLYKQFPPVDQFVSFLYQEVSLCFYYFPVQTEMAAILAAILDILARHHLCQFMPVA